MNKKKLIAILTLVCFMFTLVPVAAFAETENELISTQEALDAACTNAEVGVPMTIELADGNYTFPTVAMGNKEITFKGTREAVIDLTNVQIGMFNNIGGATLTFDGITVNWSGSEGYQGLKNAKKVVYNNCAINGLQYMYGDVDFINCTFTNKGCWSVWTYGARNATFTDCTFNTGGHAILIYNEESSSNFVANVYLKNCTFNNDGTVSELWGHEDLVETSTVEANRNGEGSNIYKLTFNNCKIVGSDKQKLWGNKNGLTLNEHLIVKYTVTWVDEDGTELKVEDVPYDTIPSCEEPTKEATAQYTYTFAGWTPEVEVTTGSAVYRATYTATVNEYTVTWVDEDGTVLEKDENVEYGTTPSYDKGEPTKAATAEYTYTFAGWTPEVEVTTGSAVYRATYTATVNEYTVTWVDENGAELEIDENVLYGAMPSYDGATPTKTEDNKFTYTFKGWDSKVVAVTGNVTYTAVYDKTEKEVETPSNPDDGNTPSASGSSGGFSGSYNYHVSIPEVDNGDVKLSDSNAVEGESVTATVTPDNGYGVADVIVTDEDGNIIPVEFIGNGQYTFVMPDGEVSVEVVCKPAITMKIGDTVLNIFGKTVKNDVAPTIGEGNITMLPIRAIANALGADVYWDADNQKVTIVKDSKVIEVFIGKDYAFVDGERIELDAKAYIENDRTYLQVRFVTEALDAEVIWDPVKRMVTIIPN